MREIGEGDYVMIEWNFGAGGPQVVHAEVLHTPADVGDHWYMKNILDEKIFTVNPACAWLVSIALEEKFDPAPF